MQIKSSVSEYTKPVCNNFVSGKSQRLVHLYRLQELAVFPFELMAKLLENFSDSKPSKWVLKSVGHGTLYTFIKECTDFTFSPQLVPTAKYYNLFKPSLQNFQPDNMASYEGTKMK